jgi:hypothetical protein
MADPATYELILRLCYEDAEAHKAVVFGKAREGAPLTDEQTALQEHAAFLAAALQDLADNRLAQSLENAVDADRALLIRLEAREKMELDDRNLALRLAGLPSARGSAAPSGFATPVTPARALNAARAVNLPAAGLRTPP